MRRPLGWDIVKLKAVTGTGTEALARQNDLFEAGADAMLEALRKMGKRIPSEISDLPHLAKVGDDFLWPKSGYKVFIPDESE